MGIDREGVEAAHADFRRVVESGNWDGFADRFAEDGSFVNSVLNEPVRGREAIRRLAAGFPKVVNQVEWQVIDGNRLAIGWNERQEGMRADAPAYRGFSTFVFDDEGLVVSYEGMFDTAALKAALGR